MKTTSFKRSIITLFLIMLGIFITGLWYANYYYEGVNNSEDPRVTKAKRLYQMYNQLAEEKKYQEIFQLLDSVESIYQQFDDYKNSYEIAVLHNNRAAIFLNLALFESFDDKETDSLIQGAEIYLNRGILIYENWNAQYGAYSEIDFQKMLKPIYYTAFSMKESTQIDTYIDKRSSELMQAQNEMNRRLSVAYTNMGIVYRHQNQIEEAVNYYKTALELWEENITAENNINILLGRPLKQRSLLNRLFPSEK